MEVKDRSNLKNRRKKHNDIVADSNRDAHKSDVAVEMKDREKFSRTTGKIGAKYDGRSRPPTELYKQRWNEIFKKGG